MQMKTSVAAGKEKKRGARRQSKKKNPLHAPAEKKGGICPSLPLERGELEKKSPGKKERTGFEKDKALLGGKPSPSKEGRGG